MFKSTPDIALEREAEGDLILGDMGQVSPNQSQTLCNMLLEVVLPIQIDIFLLC